MNEILFVLLLLSQDDIESTIQSLRQTSEMSKKVESYRSWIPFNLTSKPVLNECKSIESIEVFLFNMNTRC